MNTSRLGAGAALSFLILTTWLGACNNGDVACGVAGVKNGICRTGPTCPTGQTEIPISDPADECPTSATHGGTFYICCATPAVPAPASTSPAVVFDSGSTPPTPDAGTTSHDSGSVTDSAMATETSTSVPEASADSGTGVGAE